MLTKPCHQHDERAEECRQRLAAKQPKSVAHVASPGSQHLVRNVADQEDIIGASCEGAFFSTQSTENDCKITGNEGAILAILLLNCSANQS